MGNSKLHGENDPSKNVLKSALNAKLDNSTSSNAQSKSNSDLGTKEQLSSKDIVIEKIGFKRRARNLKSSPLLYYRQRVQGAITERQFQAGWRLFTLFYIAKYKRMPQATYGVDWTIRSVSSGQGRDGLTAKICDARQQFNNALFSIKSPRDREVLIKVCCYEILLKDLKSPYYTTGAQKIARFKEMLDDLADHFELETDKILRRRGK